MNTGGTAVPVDKGAAHGFSALVAVLSVVSTNYKVRLSIPTQNPSLTNQPQGIPAVENRIKNLLSHIVAIEDHFDSRPGDVAELNRRSEVIR